jgi:hypothetical protein
MFSKKLSPFHQNLLRAAIALILFSLSLLASMFILKNGSIVPTKHD